MPDTRAPAGNPVRLRLDSAPTRGTILDGGWWPRSTDAVAELPGLVDAVEGQRGTVTHALLNTADWDLPHPRDIMADGRQIRLGWYSSQPTGLLTMICDFDRDRFDLLVVPPRTASGAAEAAMSAAADGGNSRHAPELLADLRQNA